MNDAPWGICTYCKEDGPVRLTYFDFPIKCECCGPTHHERIQHCHNTGKVRGLLCSNCNNGMGKLGDSIERLESVINYLKKYI